MNFISIFLDLFTEQNTLYIIVRREQYNISSDIKRKAISVQILLIKSTEINDNITKSILFVNKLRKY